LYSLVVEEDQAYSESSYDSTNTGACKNLLLRHSDFNNTNNIHTMCHLFG